MENTLYKARIEREDRGGQEFSQVTWQGNALYTFGASRATCT